MHDLVDYASGLRSLADVDSRVKLVHDTIIDIYAAKLLSVPLPAIVYDLTNVTSLSNAKLAVCAQTQLRNTPKELKMDRPYKCDCGKDYRTQREWGIHQHRCSLKGKHKCDHCGKEYARLDYLKFTHQAANTPCGRKRAEVISAATSMSLVTSATAASLAELGQHVRLPLASEDVNVSGGMSVKRAGEFSALPPAKRTAPAPVPSPTASTHGKQVSRIESESALLASPKYPDYFSFVRRPPGLPHFHRFSSRVGAKEHFCRWKGCTWDRKATSWADLSEHYEMEHSYVLPRHTGSLLDFSNRTREREHLESLVIAMVDGRSKPLERSES